MARATACPWPIARGVLVGCCLGWGLLPAGAASLDFRSVAEPGTVLYDAPSAQARRLYVVSRQYPVEVIVVLEGWSKVRDAAGELSWVETRLLSPRRTVLVRAGSADVRQAGDDAAPVVFRVAKDVVLELVESGPSSWLRVRHRDGQTGYIRAADVWGV